MELKYKFKKTFIVTAIGAVGNIVLSVIKVVFGLLSNSHAVLADGIHSLSDLFSDAVVVVCLKISCRPPSRDKPYGNKKLESITQEFQRRKDL